MLDCGSAAPGHLEYRRRQVFLLLQLRLVLSLKLDDTMIFRSPTFLSSFIRPPSLSLIVILLHSSNYLHFLLRYVLSFILLDAHALTNFYPAIFIIITSHQCGPIWVEDTTSAVLNLERWSLSHQIHPVCTDLPV